MSASAWTEYIEEVNRREAEYLHVEPEARFKDQYELTPADVRELRKLDAAFKRKEEGGKA